jgi:hypothetical protein
MHPTVRSRSLPRAGGGKSPRYSLRSWGADPGGAPAAASCCPPRTWSRWRRRRSTGCSPMGMAGWGSSGAAGCTAWSRHPDIVANSLGSRVRGGLNVWRSQHARSHRDCFEQTDRTAASRGELRYDNRTILKTLIPLLSKLGINRSEKVTALVFNAFLGRRFH